MHVVVIIVGFRNTPQVRDCVDAIGKSSYQDFTVLVCENGGFRSFDELSACCPTKLSGGQKIHIFCAPENLGYAGGVNFCLKLGYPADAYWVINPDTQADAWALERFVQKFQRSACQMIGGRLLNSNGSIQTDGGLWRAWCARSVSLNRGRVPVEALTPAKVEKSLSFISGASLFFVPSVLEAIGPMREDYFLYCEEVEWCLRAKAAGINLGFVDDAVVYHHQGGTTGSGNDKSHRPKLPIYLDERNKINVVRDTSPRLLPLAILFSLVTLFGRYGKPGSVAQLWFGLQGWRAGIMNKRFQPAWLRK